MLINWLRRRYPVDKRKFMLVGIGMAAINALVLMGLVSFVGMNPLAANLSRQALTTPVHFGIHRRFTWSSQRHRSLWGQWWRYLSLKAGTMLAKQLCFLVLVAWLGMSYMIAYTLCVCAFGLTKFNLTKRFIFKIEPDGDDSSH